MSDRGDEPEGEPLATDAHIDSCCAAAATAVNQQNTAQDQLLQQLHSAELTNAQMLQMMQEIIQNDPSHTTLQIVQFQLQVADDAAADDSAHESDEDEGEPEGLAEIGEEVAMVEVWELVVIAENSIDASEKACGMVVPQLQLARELISENTESAVAEAQMLIHRVLLTCHDEANESVKRASRDARDVVIHRCRANCEDRKNRIEFLARIEVAYKGKVDKELRAQLLLAYHKDTWNQKCGFDSNNHLATVRRGRPRNRRQRKQAKK